MKTRVKITMEYDITHRTPVELENALAALRDPDNFVAYESRCVGVFGSYSYKALKTKKQVEIVERAEQGEAK